MPQANSWSRCHSPKGSATRTRTWCRAWSPPTRAKPLPCPLPCPSVCSMPNKCTWVWRTAIWLSGSRTRRAVVTRAAACFSTRGLRCRPILTGRGWRWRWTARRGSWRWWHRSGRRWHVVGRWRRCRSTLTNEVHQEMLRNLVHNLYYIDSFFLNILCLLFWLLFLVLFGIIHRVK